MIEPVVDQKTTPPSSPPPDQSLPRTQQDVAVKKSKYRIRDEGESGRRGIDPMRTIAICFRANCTLAKYVNFLWPFVPVALALHWARPDKELWNFILPYIAIVPAANTLGFGGQELARKLPHVLGVIIETTFGSLVEIVLFMVLISKGERSVPIIKAAILGSILANLLLCLGVCFFAGGIRPGRQQKGIILHEAVSEVGSNLLLVAAMGLVVPAAFSGALTQGEFTSEVLTISRASAIVLLLAFISYVVYQQTSHSSLYKDIILVDEQGNEDRDKELAKPKLTMAEAILVVGFALAMVSLMAVFLVQKIYYVVSRGIKDAFLGLILVPLVEKAAEHISAVDESWDGQQNLALTHILGSSIQTALFNTPLVVIVGWGLHVPMDLNFESFDAIVLILAVLVVGNFLRDAKTDYLEGILLVLVYIIIAIAAFNYPNPRSETGSVSGGG